MLVGSIKPSHCLLEMKMKLPGSSRFQFTPDLTICRILNGMWQVSGAHGYIEPAGHRGDVRPS